MISWLLDWYVTICVTVVTLCLVTYLVPIAVAFWVWKPQNLKDKYNAKWALVTGGSSGLGKAIVEKMAEQGINVVIAALGDQLLETTTAEMKAKFPKVEFRSVPVNFGKSDHENGHDYMETLINATKDIDISVVFNNAGYIILKGFLRTPVDKLLANYECNATSHFRITHHFVNKMVEKKIKGCVVYTSSTTSFMGPLVPANAMYAATKAFISALGSSLAVEVQTHGIDVLVVNMGPMTTRFWDNSTQISMATPFRLLETPPSKCADVMLTSVGRLHLRDHSILTIAFRTLFRIVDPNVLSKIVAACVPFMPDSKKTEVIWE